MAKTAAKRRSRRIVWLGIVLLFVALGIGVAKILGGGKPLRDGATLAGGRIITSVSNGFIAAYIVRLEAGVALVDAGMDPTAADLLASLAAHGFDATDVRAIFLTHGHGDHIGGALAFPDAAVYVPMGDADLVRGERTADNLLGRFRDPEPTGIAVDVPLTDGAIIEVGGTTFEVFVIPGHTRGSAAYLIHGVLFLGDSAGASIEETVASAPPAFSWDREVARESLLNLAERLEPRRDEIVAIAFGHQGALEGADALYAWYNSHRNGE